MDKQPESIQNFIMRRKTSLAGLDCEGGCLWFSLIQMNTFSQKLYVVFILFGLIHHMDEMSTGSEWRLVSCF